MKLGNQLTTILAVVALLAIAMVVYYTFYSPLRISSEEAKKAISEGTFPIVVDVRTDLEYNLGHYPEAVHIPTALLKDEAKQRLQDKDKGILIYCNTGQRSRAAADLLKAKGYTNVRYITGPYWSLLR
jgi:rhodanese-related sulfurtransferase